MCYKKQLKNYMKKLMAMVLAGTMLAAPLSADAYIPTNRDTKVAPEKAQYTQEDLKALPFLRKQVPFVFTIEMTETSLLSKINRLAM